MGKGNSSSSHTSACWTLHASTSILFWRSSSAQYYGSLHLILACGSSSSPLPPATSQRYRQRCQFCLFDICSIMHHTVCPRFPGHIFSVELLVTLVRLATSILHSRAPDIGLFNTKTNLQCTQTRNSKPYENRGVTVYMHIFPSPEFSDNHL